MASESRRVGAELRRFIETAVRKVTFRAFQALTSANPVDTGFSRAGWSPSAGVPAPGPSRRPAEIEIAETLAAQLFARHSDAAAALLGGYRLAQGPTYIVNNVEYLLYLNLGTSAQAPAMWIERAVQTAVEATARELSR